MSTHTLATMVGTTGNRYFDLIELRELFDYLGAVRTDPLLDKFAEDLPRYGSALEVALMRNDMAALASAVHVLRGTALTFSCRGLAKLCDSLRVRSQLGDPKGCRDAALSVIQGTAHALEELKTLRAPDSALWRCRRTPGFSDTSSASLHFPAEFDRSAGRVLEVGDADAG